MRRDLKRGLDDSHINAGQDGGNNWNKPLIAAWRHAWCHPSHKGFSRLNPPWHHGGTILAPGDAT
jgi:hypothetical protein